jgi:hypothetical protein
VQHSHFLPEDGATYHGSITAIERDRYSVERHARIEVAGSIRTEARDYGKASSHLEAVNWIGQGAVSRGFMRFYLEKNGSTEIVLITP